MRTDALLLTVANEVYAAEQALKEANAAKLDAERKATAASTKATECLSNLTRLRNRLLELASAKPAEPAPRVEVPQKPIPAAMPVDLKPVASISPAQVDKAEVVRESRLKEAVAKMPSHAPVGPVPNLNSKRR